MEDTTKKISPEQEKRFQEMEDMLWRYNRLLNTPQRISEPKFDEQEFRAMRDWQGERMANLPLD